MAVSLEIGSLVQFLYPRHNFRGVVRDTMELRRISVTAVRDIRDDPLTSDDILREPNLRRGRLLVTGYDLDKHAERSFYVESMAELRELDRTQRRPPLKVAVFKDGQIAEPAERPDPRDDFAASFNEQGRGYGLEAVA